MKKHGMTPAFLQENNIPNRILTFEQKTKPIFEKLEATRKKFLHQFFLRWLSVVLLVVILISAEFYFSNTFISIGLTAVACFIVYYFKSYITVPMKLYNLFYKQKVIPLLLKAIGQYSYTPKNKTVNEETFKDFDLVPQYDKIEAEDFISGDIMDTNFEFSELKLIKNKKELFKGCAIILNMPFNFAGHTLIYKNTGAVSHLEHSLESKGSPLKVMNKEFSKLFDIYSNDEYATGHILSENMMTHLIKLFKIFHKQANAEYLFCEFKGNKALFLCEYQKDLIEPTSLFTSAYEADKLNIGKKQLKIINQIVRDFQLYYSEYVNHEQG